MPSEGATFMDDMVQAIEKIHEHRLDFKPAAVNEGE